MIADAMLRWRERVGWPRVIGAAAAALALVGMLWFADQTARAERGRSDQASAALVAGYLRLVTPADSTADYRLTMLLSAVHTLAADRRWNAGLQVAWHNAPLLPEQMGVAPLDAATQRVLAEGYRGTRVERAQGEIALVPLLDKDAWNTVGWVAVANTVPDPGHSSVAMLLLVVTVAAVLSALYLARPGETATRRAGIVLVALAMAAMLAHHLTLRSRAIASRGTQAVLQRGDYLVRRAIRMPGVVETQLSQAVPGLRVAMFRDGLEAAPGRREARDGWAVRRVELPSGRVLELGLPAREAQLGGLTLRLGAGVLLLGLGLGFAAWGGAARARRRAYRETLTAWGFLAPALGHLAVFAFAPLAFAGWLALHRWGLVEPVRPFVGLDNFREILSDGAFWHSLGVTALYGLYVPVTMVVSLAAALVLDRSGLRVRLVRTVLFLPFISSVVAVALVWQWMYQPDYGLINYLLRLVGMSGPDWLGDPRTALPALMLLSVWVHLGYQMVIFLAGLQAIPAVYHDAARVDGASAWQRFRRITLPLLRPTVLFVLVTGTISSFQVFTFVSVMTEGGPLHATDVIVYRIYQEAWEFLRFGTASAMSLVLLAILLVVTWLQFRWLGRKVEVL